MKRCLNQLFRGLSLVALISAAQGDPSLHVNKIIVGPQGKDDKSDFSIRVSFRNTWGLIQHWQFGFYMPRNFRSFNHSNRQLSMQICEVSTQRCMRLAYLKDQFSQPDLSTVFTTVVGPVSQYALKSGQTYIISLLHNSSHGPQNYSSLPQNMFLATEAGVIPLLSEASNYQITNYQASQVQQAIAKHLQQTWQDSSLESVPLAIIPAPQQVNLLPEQEGYHLTGQQEIFYNDSSTREVAQLWAQALESDLNLPVKMIQADSNPHAGISLQLVGSEKISNPEGYQININQQQLQIQASNPAGLFYALQTMRQLWFASPDLAAMLIRDQPRFAYRGMLLDVARHYLSVDEIKNFIDIMASLKLNSLHLHLSDDEAFRLRLTDFPQLTTLAAKRGWGWPIGPLSFPQANLTKAKGTIAGPASIYQGSYNAADIRSLISYANARQITIIPELDIPGHSRALMKGLPDSFYESGDSTIYAGYGDNSLPICAYDSQSDFGRRFTTALTKILWQTMQMFNQQTTVYAIKNELSIGGDEVFKGTWDHSPACQNSPWKQMSALEKQHYFLDMLNNDAEINQLRLSGWHEFVMTKTGTVNPHHRITAEETGHVWAWGKSSEAMTKAVTLANAGYPVVLAYSDSLYFDMTYTPLLSEPGFYWATQFSDTAASLSSSQQASQTQAKSQQPNRILGLEGALWTDVIPDYQQLQYMALPKITGLAEASWSTPATSKTTNWRSLATRLGCGTSGYLAFVHATFQANYRGYPNGIQLEAPQLCR